MTEIDFTKNQWCDFIMRNLYIHAVKKIIGYPVLFNEAKYELINKGIIEISSEFEEWHQLTELGYKIVESGLNYDEWLLEN